MNTSITAGTCSATRALHRRIITAGLRYTRCLTSRRIDTQSIASQRLITEGRENNGQVTPKHDAQAASREGSSPRAGRCAQEAHGRKGSVESWSCCT